MFYPRTARNLVSLHHGQQRGFNHFIYFQAWFSSTFANGLNRSKGAAPAVICRLLMVSNAITQGEKVFLAMHSPGLVPQPPPPYLTYGDPSASWVSMTLATHVHNVDASWKLQHIWALPSQKVHSRIGNSGVNDWYKGKDMKQLLYK